MPDNYVIPAGRKPGPIGSMGPPLTTAGDDVWKLPPEIAAPLSRSWTEAEAFAYCSALTKAHYENFPVGSVLMPASVQPAIHSLYAFMRTADDFSDENRKTGDEGERLAWLASWDRMLEECVEGRAQHPIFIALHKTLREYQLPVQWLKDLLQAFTMDITVNRYETYEDVVGYCRYSANPVGRLILTLCGYRDEKLYELSDAICSGLQLANHWQDVAVDLKKDRVYLPQADLRSHQVTLEQLKAGEVSENFKRLMALEVGRAKQLFATGQPLPELVGGRLRWELRFTWQGGVRILEKIEAVNYDVFQHRPVVTVSDWLLLGWRTLIA